MTRLRTWFALVVVATFATSPATATVPPSTPGAPTPPAASATVVGGAPEQAASAFLVADAATGMVLAGKELHLSSFSASTAKTITALTAMRVLDPTTVLDISDLANSRVASRLDMKPSELWPFMDAMWGLMVRSANDAAYALAENTSGNLIDFAAEMTETGRLLGMQDSRFLDPAGLDAPSDTPVRPTFVSVWDLAIAARAVLANPTLAEMARAPVHTLTTPSGVTLTLETHNKMMLPDEPQYYPGTIGIKTGFTDNAQGTFIAAATRGDRTLVVAILDAPDIFGVARSLFDWGFAQPVMLDAGLGTLPAPVVFPPGVHPSRIPEGVGDLAAVATLPVLPPTTVTVPVPTSIDESGSVVVLDPAEADDGSSSGTDTPAVVLVAAAAALLGGAVLILRRPVAKGRRVRMDLDSRQGDRRKAPAEPDRPFSASARARQQNPWPDDLDDFRSERTRRR